jgi:hypothetical protein
MVSWIANARRSGTLTPSSCRALSWNDLAGGAADFVPAGRPIV